MGLPDPPRLPDSLPADASPQSAPIRPAERRGSGATRVGAWVPAERRTPDDLIPWRSNNSGFAQDFPSDPFPPAVVATPNASDRPEGTQPPGTEMVSQTRPANEPNAEGAWRRSATAEQNGWNSASSSPIEGSYWPPVANRVDLASPPPATNFAVQMSKSRRFSLDYDVSGIAPGDIAKIELWISDDQGQTWRAHGIDADMTTPFPVEVDRDGSFGFRLLVHDHGGSVDPPQPGESPDLRVAVDRTAAVAKLESARLLNPPVNVDVAQSPGQLEIIWSATDEFLSELPIRLSYSSSPNHSWISIAQPLANTGRFDWTMPADVPARLYLRMEVSDRAGNASIHQLAEPVQTRPVVPRARIRAISPL